MTMCEIVMALSTQSNNKYCLTNARFKSMKKNIIRVVKLAAFYSFIGIILQSLLVGVLFASSSAEGQVLRDVKITLNAHRVTFEQALNEIEESTNFKFTYVKDEIPLDEEVTINVRDESLYDILERFAGQYNLVFKRVNKQIVIKKGSAPVVNEVPDKQETGSIKGKIIYANSEEPVFGANIIIIGTNFGAATDMDGEFFIKDVPVNEYTIQISYIGCVQKKEKIRIIKNKTLELNYALQQSLVNLDEVVVTGTMSERKMRAVSNSISVLSEKELENRNLTSLATVLEAIPGIEISGITETINQMNSGTPYAYINIRGGAPLSNVVTSAGVKYFVDGVEISDGSYLNTIDPNDIKKIEVSRGPMSSTLYGAGSSGGIIQIFTKKGGMDKLRVNLRSMFISKKSKYQDKDPLNQQYTLNISGGQGEFGYSFGINHSINPNSRFKDNNGIDYNAWDINAGVNAKISDLTADLKFQYSQNTSGSYQSNIYYKAALEEGWADPDLVKDYVSSSETVTDGALASLNLKHVLTDSWYHNLTVGYARNGFENNSLTDPWGSGYMMMMRDFKKFSARYFTNLLQPFSNDFNVDVTAGIEYVNYEFVDWGNNFTTKQEDYQSQSYSSGYGGFRSKYPTTTTGIFAEAVWGYFDKLFLTTGVRTEKNSGYGDGLGWYTMPRIGLSYVENIGQLTMKPRFSWGKSSEPANPYYKVGSYSQGWRNYLPNPELKPQSQSGYEVGADIYYSYWASFNITYYKQKVDDLIVGVNLGTQEDGSTPDYQYQNIAEADNKGLEVSAKFIYDRLSLDVSFTSVSSKYGENYTNSYDSDRIANVPSGSFFVRLSSSLPSIFDWTKKGGNISLEYRWNGDVVAFDSYNYNKDRSNGTSGSYYDYYRELPGYSKWNLRADYSVLDELSVFVDVYNLLDNQDWISGYPMVGRSISFGFNYQY